MTEKTTPNPNHLPPKERARCDHIERVMAPSGRYSTCSECFNEGVRRSIQKDPAGVIDWMAKTEGDA